jgi:PAS domain S-box-containing protein
MAAPQRRSVSRTQSFLQRSPRLLRYSILALTAAIVATDFTHDDVVAVCALYAIPILFSLWLERRRYTLILACSCAALALLDLLVGHKLEPIDQESRDRLRVILINRAIAVFTIGIVTSLGLMRLKADRDLRYVRKIALTTLRSLGEAVITINTHGRVRFVNRAAERLLGLRRMEAVGRDLEDVFVTSEERAPRPPVVELEHRHIGETTEALLHTRAGRRCPIELTRTPIVT